MAAKKGKYKSKFEEKVAARIRQREGVVKYEPCYFPYAIQYKYKPDFQLRNGIYIETKGEFDYNDRRKHLAIKKSWPLLDIRFVFMAPYNKIRKGSKATYADWCDKHGFKWAAGEPPDEWFKDRKGVLRIAE